jgi:hypothetical protein
MFLVEQRLTVESKRQMQRLTVESKRQIKKKVVEQRLTVESKGNSCRAAIDSRVKKANAAIDSRVKKANKEESCFGSKLRRGSVRVLSYFKRNRLITVIKYTELLHR